MKWSPGCNCCGTVPPEELDETLNLTDQLEGVVRCNTDYTGVTVTVSGFSDCDDTNTSQSTCTGRTYAKLNGSYDFVPETEVSQSVRYYENAFDATGCGAAGPLTGCAQNLAFYLCVNFICSGGVLGINLYSRTSNDIGDAAAGCGALILNCDQNSTLAQRTVTVNMTTCCEDHPSIPGWVITSPQSITLVVEFF